MLRQGCLHATLEAVDENTRVFMGILQTEALSVGAAMKHLLSSSAETLSPGRR